jgi:hypothetical protein
LACLNSAWPGQARFVSARFDLARLGSARLGVTWFDLSRLCLYLLDLARLILNRLVYAPWLIWTGAENLVPIGIQSLTVQLVDQSLYWLSYRAHSFSLYTQHWYSSYRFADTLRAWSWSRLRAVSKTVWHTTLLWVQWMIPDDRQRKCPKYVDFHYKIHFGKIRLSGWFYYNDLSRCTVSWTSNLSINNEQNTVEMWWNTVTHGTGSEGETGQCSGKPVLFTLPRKIVYPVLRSLMRTTRLPAVDCTDPADLNGLVRSAKRRNLVSAFVASHFKRSLPNMNIFVTEFYMLVALYMWRILWRHDELHSTHTVSFPLVPPDIT